MISQPGNGVILTNASILLTANWNNPKKIFFFGSRPKFGADSFVYLNMKVKY